MFELTITDLSHDGRGIGHHQGKTLFVDNALPGETVQVTLSKTHKHYDEANLKNIVQPSADRVSPFCAVYATCGGCQLQHFAINAQRNWKQTQFMDALAQQINLKKCTVLPALQGEDKGYRRRAKLVVGKCKTNKQPQVGFKQPQSDKLVDITHCPILRPELNDALAQARPELLAQASRALKELPIVVANEGVFGLSPSQQQPSYTLNQLKLNFQADGFIQVNETLNQQMVAQAIDWLKLEPHHQVLDLFCGMGNFSLPIAQTCQSVVGIEGEANLVQLATHNAHQNGLTNAHFFKANLFDADHQLSEWFHKKHYHRILLDPGRLGAKTVCELLPKLNAEIIVYVSCHTATLIRDLALLQKAGYQVTQAGMIDMFPHTTHSEAMVQLTKVSASQAHNLSKKKKKAIFKF